MAIGSVGFAGVCVWVCVGLRCFEVGYIYLSPPSKVEGAHGRQKGMHIDATKLGQFRWDEWGVGVMEKGDGSSACVWWWYGGVRCLDFIFHFSRLQMEDTKLL